MTKSILEAMSSQTGTTWNGAVSNATVGSDKYAACLEYYSKCGTYRGRSQADVDLDMGRIFGDDPAVALKIVFGLRLITRTPEGSEDTATGFGQRDEFYKCCKWLLKNRPQDFLKNMYLIPVFGSWKDFFDGLIEEVSGLEQFYDLINGNHEDDLLKKYLPTIRSSGKIRSERDRKRVEVAKKICKELKITPKAYRVMKASGKAHIWQQQMTRQEWDAIDFNQIPGKAMHNLVQRKGKDGVTTFERRGQIERLRVWVEAQPMIKFTGYPYELTRKLCVAENPSVIQKMVAERQFETLANPFKGHRLGNVLCAVDTSGSMQGESVAGVRAYDICLSMGLIFSHLNIGHFKDHIVAFDDVSRLIRLNGGWIDRLHQIERMTTAWGSTNFNSVIQLLVNIRAFHPEIPIADYPETLLVISDMQFNPIGGNTETNYVVAMKQLTTAGLGHMRIIWWNVNGKGSDFPSQMNDKGVYMISGFDPANLLSLCGLTKEDKKKEKTTTEIAAKQQETPLDGMMNWLKQPVFSLLHT